MYRYKKIIAFLMSMAIFLPCLPISAYADNESISEEQEENDGTTVSGDYTYYVDSENNAYLISCTSQESVIDVPSEIDGYKVTELYDTAFAELPVEVINIPDSIEYISSENPFVQCENLTEINVDPNNEYYCSVDGVIYSKDMKSLVCYPQAKWGESFNIPDGIEELKTACLYNTELSSITFPDSLKTMQRHCLGYNHNIKSIDLSNTSITQIAIMAFVQCTSLEEIKFPSTLEEISLAAFFGCTSLAEIELPDGLYSIGQSAFSGTALKEVKIPSSVENIEYSAFGYDENDEAVDDFLIIGDSGSVAEKYATDSDSEYDYYNDFNFMTTESAEQRDAYLALNTKMSADGNYEYSVDENGEAILVSCVSTDVTVTVPEEIDGYKVTSVYEGAFQFCQPDEIILPEGIKSIGEDAFPDCVKRITIPASCDVIEGDEPFLNCYSLEEITVTDGNSAYSSENGVLYNADKSSLIAYPMQKQDSSYTAPESVKTIEYSAFYYNPYIQNVDISSAETINSYAFESCTALTSVKLSKDLNFVGNDVFYNCTALKSVRLYDKLETIGDYAFGYYYDSTATSDSENATGDIVVDGFKIYAEEGTLGYQYAQACGIEAVTNTVEISNHNVDKTFLGVITAVVSALIIGGVGVAIGKSAKSKKKGGKK